MAKPNTVKPTDAELAVLQILWNRGPSTVRQVHEILSSLRNTGYTTTLKIMQIMTEKGLVTRDQSQKTHVYQALADKDCTQRQLVCNLLDRAFEGSAKTLIMQALSTQKTSAKELADIREFLDSIEEQIK